MKWLDVIPSCHVFIVEDTEGDVVTNYFKKKTKRLGLLAFLKSAQDSILPQRLKKAF